MSYSEMKEQICTNVKKINEIIDDVNSSDKEQNKLKNAFTRHINSDHNGMITDKQINDINSIPGFKEEVSAQLETIVIDVKKFGAKGDGFTDDTVALQKAFNYASNRSFILSLIDGEFLTTDTLYIKSNLNVIGRNAKITGDSIFIEANEGVENININGITFKRKTLSFNESDRSIIINGWKNVNIYNCKFEGYNGDAIIISKLYGSDFIPSKINIINCEFDGLNAENRNAITIFQGTDITIKNNYFHDLSKNGMPGGIDIEPWEYETKNVMVQNVYIENNVFNNIKGSSCCHMYLDYGLLDVLPISNIQIKGNRFENCSQLFIYLEDSLHETRNLEYNFSHHIVIENNLFRGANDTGLFLMLLSGINGCFVKNNTFDNTNSTILIGDMIWYEGYKQCKNIYITNNNFINPNTGAEQFLFMVGGIYNFIFGNNTITSTIDNDANKILINFVGDVTRGKCFITNNIVTQTKENKLYKYFVNYPNKLDLVLKDNLNDLEITKY